MATRQQVLRMWLAEAALDSPVVAWAWHDGAAGEGPGLPEGDPPYPHGEAALQDGWCLLQVPPPQTVTGGAEHATSALLSEFVFERRVDVER